MANVELPTLELDALALSRGNQGFKHMLVMCCGGGGWSDGMDGISGIVIKGALDFSRLIMDVYRQDVGHESELVDLLGIDKVVNVA